MDVTADKMQWMNIFKPQAKPRFAWPEAMSLALYAVVLFWCIPHHALWFDEAQAWLIARDLTLSEMLLHRLHYEGAPALWYLLLWIETRLHISLLGMHLIAGVIAVAGVYVWLRFNPLPRFLSLLVPFSFFILYQYAVIARSYVLVPLFAFSLMALHKKPNSNPLLFALAAGLMANCSGHMAAYAIGMVIWYGRDRLLARGSNSERRPIMLAALLFTVLLGLAAAVAWPTSDYNFGKSNPTIRFLSHAWPVHRATPPPIAIPPSSVATAPADEPSRVAKLLVRLLTVITVPISDINLLTLLFLFLLALNLYFRGRCITVLPPLMVALFFAFVDGASHHTGIVWIGLLCCVWELASQPPKHNREKLLGTALYAVTGLVVALQIGWSIHCLRNDLDGSYSGYRQAADYLRRLPTGTRIATFDVTTVTVNAFLPDTPFYNSQSAYWPFSKTADPSLDFDRVIAEKPGMVLAEEQNYVSHIQNQWIAFKKPGVTPDDIERATQLIQHGYHVTHRFCGLHVFRNETEFVDCGVIYEPDVKSAGASVRK
jgi:hypothetical protein